MTLHWPFTPKISNNLAIYTATTLQDPATQTSYLLIKFHDHVLFFARIILSIVLVIIIRYLNNTLFSSKVINNNALEIVWTILPALVLILIAIPSLRILYHIDEARENNLAVKAIGHQWYWRYEYGESNLAFDSYILAPESSLNQYRLLDTDIHLVLPYKTPLCVTVTREDVIHSWTIPSLLIKMDAVPGRLNSIYFTLRRPGLFFGQCSELCGVNHSFMPICVEAISFPCFNTWASNLT